jgi:hypothetical protein
MAPRRTDRGATARAVANPVDVYNEFRQLISAYGTDRYRELYNAVMSEAPEAYELRRQVGGYPAGVRVTPQMFLYGQLFYDLPLAHPIIVDFNMRLVGLQAAQNKTFVDLEGERMSRKELLRNLLDPVGASLEDPYRSTFHELLNSKNGLSEGTMLHCVGELNHDGRRNANRVASLRNQNLKEIVMHILLSTV